MRNWRAFIGRAKDGFERASKYKHESRRWVKQYGPDLIEGFERMATMIERLEWANRDGAQCPVCGAEIARMDGRHYKDCELDALLMWMFNTR